MSVGRERRVEREQRNLQIEEALHGRGGGTVGHFEAKLHPRDRTGKWRETFTSPEHRMMGPSSTAHPGGESGPPPGAKWAVSVNGGTPWYIHSVDQLGEEAETFNAYAETDSSYKITDLRSGREYLNAYPPIETLKDAPRVSRRGDERPNALSPEEHQFARAFGPIPTDTAGLREFRARVAERIASSPDDGGPRFRAQTRKLQASTVKKIDAAIRSGRGLIVPQAPAPAPAPPRADPYQARLDSIRAATGLSVTEPESAFLPHSGLSADLHAMRAHAAERIQPSPDDGGPEFRRRARAAQKSLLTKIDAALASSPVVGAPGSAFNPHPGARVQIHTPDGNVHTGSSLGNGLAFVQRRNSVTGIDEMHVYHIKHGVGLGSIGAAGRDASTAKYAFQRHWAGANTNQSIAQLRADPEIRARATNMRPIIDATNTPAHDAAWQAQRERAGRTLAPTDALDAALGAHRRGILSDHIAGLSPVQRELVRRGAERFPTVDGVPEIMGALGGGSAAPVARERRVQAETERVRGQRSGAVVGGKAGRWVPIRGKKKHIPLDTAWEHDAGGGVKFSSPAGTTDVYRSATGSTRELVSTPGQRMTHPEVQRTWSPNAFDVATHWKMTPNQRALNLQRLSDAELQGAMEALRNAPGTTALGARPGARRSEDAGGKERAIAEVFDVQKRRIDSMIQSVPVDERTQIQTLGNGALHAIIDSGDPARAAVARAEIARRRQNTPQPTRQRLKEADDVEEAEFSAGARRKLAKKGAAMPGGGFPIRNMADLKNAIQALGRAKDKAAAQRHIIKRAHALGLESALPTDWKVKEAEMDGRERRVIIEMLASDPALIALAEASDKGAEPFSTSKTSNWVARAGGLPHYIQHIAHDLMEKRGMDESKAIALAIGIVKRWARGGGKVKPDTRAAAAKAVAEWESKRAAAHAKSAA